MLSLRLRVLHTARPAPQRGSSHGTENFRYCCWRDFRAGSVGSPHADLVGVASCYWRLVSTNVGELGRSRRSWRPRLFWVALRRAPARFLKSLARTFRDLRSLTGARGEHETARFSRRS